MPIQHQSTKKIKTRLQILTVKFSLVGLDKLLVKLSPHLSCGMVKLWEPFFCIGFEYMEQEILELGVIFFGGVQIGENPVAAGEVSAGHVDAREDVLLLHFTDIKENGEALGVEKDYDAGIGKQRRAGRHIHSEYGALVFLNALLEEAIDSFLHEIVEAIRNGSDDGQAITSRDLLNSFIAWRSHARNPLNSQIKQCPSNDWNTSTGIYIALQVVPHVKMSRRIGNSCGFTFTVHY